MNDLFNFNKEDILTGVTVDKAVLGTKGFFGNSIDDLVSKIKRNAITTLSNISRVDGYCFMNEFERHYTLFLPLDKVNKPSCRQLNNIDELFDFLMQDFDTNDICDQAKNKAEIDRYEKAKILIGKKITLRSKEDGLICVMQIQDVCFLNELKTFLNGKSLENLFEDYEFRRGDTFVPFGVNI